jgi:UDP-N-acetylmuramoyl-L-alanyl-D-glutamate--2,6-diaminopimelate ligase
MMAAALTAAMTLGELLGSGAGAHAGIAIRDLVLDSRQVSAGAAFVAVPGGRNHGLEFAEQALARGAAVVLYEPSPAFARVPEPSVAVPDLRSRLGDLAKTYFGRGATRAVLAGVTGTNGKTTVAYVIAQALQSLGTPCGYIGTLGFGRPPSLATHALTTPDCLTLHREIAALGTPRVVLEVSSHALAQDRIAGLGIGTAVFTNLTRDHLDEHGDFASYGRAKARLFRRPGLADAVVNLDDPFAPMLLAAIERNVRTIGVSLRGAHQAALDARFVSHGLKGLELRIAGKYGPAAMFSRMVGGFNAENLLLALGALLAWDVELTDACGALAQCMPPRGRMEVIGGRAAPHVVIDYAHSPDALERVLQVLAEVATGEVWCVFGCGGERDRGKRPIMGAVAARLAQHVVLTDDNPRSEDPASIVTDICGGIDAQADVVVEHDRAAAIAYAIRAARPGDVVLVAGKGHEAVQAIGAARRPFDDREVAAAALGSAT